jgi:hypothetical protein
MSKSKNDSNGGQGSAGVFTPPPLQSDGRVAKHDEYAARIAETQPYWEFVPPALLTSLQSPSEIRGFNFHFPPRYPHRQDMVRALALVIAAGDITEADVLAQMRRHNKEVAQFDDPDLEIMSEEHAARYSLASWRDIGARHHADLALILHRLAALNPSFAEAFTTKLMHIHKVNSEERRKMRAAAAQAKADAREAKVKAKSQPDDAQAAKKARTD